MRFGDFEIKLVLENFDCVDFFFGDVVGVVDYWQDLVWFGVLVVIEGQGELDVIFEFVGDFCIVFVFGIGILVLQGGLVEFGNIFWCWQV